MLSQITTLLILMSGASVPGCSGDAPTPPHYDCSVIEKSDEAYIALDNAAYPLAAQFIIVTQEDGRWIVAAFGWRVMGAAESYSRQTRFFRGAPDQRVVESFRAKFASGAFDTIVDEQKSPQGEDVICIDATILHVYAASAQGEFSGNRNTCFGRTIVDDFASALEEIAVSADIEMRSYLHRLSGQD